MKDAYLRGLERVRKFLVDVERDMRRYPGNEDAKIHYRCAKREEQWFMEKLGLLPDKQAALQQQRELELT